ncbi:hypothetical protein GQ53DRAFT_746772 [Thozetella sp. PMI_491]|nr:hypothetical protein GQ53DRAFT_746772 [Thozetella sp. PMI_491]
MTPNGPSVLLPRPLAAEPGPATICADGAVLPLTPPVHISPDPDALHSGATSQSMSCTTGSLGTGNGLTWFLASDTWEVEDHNHSIPPSPLALFKAHNKVVQGWLRDFAVHGHNAFIHRELYRAGLPTCLQDAYTALVAYLAKNEEIEDMVLQILEDRATDLYQQYVLLDGVEVLDVCAHLARTQALLIYNVIRLHDGCPRQRAHAEATMPALERWLLQMWEAATAYAQTLYGAWESRALDPDGELELAVWHAWILTESVRRTWLVSTSTMKIHQTLKSDWIQCSGGVGVTARAGLWDATSAPRWMRQVQREGPIFTPANRVPSLMKESYFELDDFIKQMFSISIAPEQIEHWRARNEVG